MGNGQLSNREKILKTNNQYRKNIIVPDPQIDKFVKFQPSSKGNLYAFLSSADSSF